VYWPLALVQIDVLALAEEFEERQREEAKEQKKREQKEAAERKKRAREEAQKAQQASGTTNLYSKTYSRTKPR
jgi:hypothetical protein